MESFAEAMYSYLERNGASTDDCESEEENNYYDIDENSKCFANLITKDKVFVCDSEKIYICLYKELEEYRISKQSQKKNAVNAWNNLSVILPTRGIICMKTIPTINLKNVKKVVSGRSFEEGESFKAMVAARNKQEAESNNNNMNPNLHTVKVEIPKVEPSNPPKPEKKSKKKLKKQKQKEKKKAGKENKELQEKERDGDEQEMKVETTEDPEEEPEEFSFRDILKYGSKAESLNFMEDEDSDSEIKAENESATDIDLLNEIPAFVSQALKKNEKKSLIKKEEKLYRATNLSKAAKKIVEQKAVKEKSTKKPASVEERHGKQQTDAKLSCTLSNICMQESNIDSDFDFTLKKRPKPSGSDCREAVFLGKRAVKLILKDDIPRAVEFLSEAIFINNYDLRHFLNRSFCFLRLGAFNLALKDAQNVIKYTNENEELIKAKFRAGQAFCGLQNFKEAEKSLEEAYNFSQADPIIHRELMHIRILQLLDMGFREYDILEAFKEKSTVLDVISLLTEKQEDYYSEYEGECNEDDIYNSDDEENPSFTRIISNILKYQPNAPHKTNHVNVKQQQQSTAAFKKLSVPVKTQVVNKEINNKAIWVGNTPSEITESMLRKRFSKYGKVVSIFRKPSESYTFINFESSKSVSELLSSTSTIEMDGHKLPIKAATRAK